MEARYRGAETVEALISRPVWVEPVDVLPGLIVSFVNLGSINNYDAKFLNVLALLLLRCIAFKK